MKHEGSLGKMDAPWRLGSSPRDHKMAHNEVMETPQEGRRLAQEPCRLILELRMLKHRAWNLTGAVEARSEAGEAYPRAVKSYPGVPWSHTGAKSLQSRSAGSSRSYGGSSRGYGGSSRSHGDSPSSQRSAVRPGKKACRIIGLHMKGLWLGHDILRPL